MEDVPESWPVESSEDLYRSSLPFALRADRIRHPDKPRGGAVHPRGARAPRRRRGPRRRRRGTRVLPAPVPPPGADADARAARRAAGRRGGGAPGRRRARAARGGRARGERLGAVGVGVQLARHHLRADPLLPGPRAPRGRSWRLHARPRGGGHGDAVGAVRRAAGRLPGRTGARRTGADRGAHRPATGAWSATGAPEARVGRHEGRRPQGSQEPRVPRGHHRDRRARAGGPWPRGRSSRRMPASGRRSATTSTSPPAPRS